MKSIEYELNCVHHVNKLKFRLELKSIALQFEEININNISNDQDKEENKEEKKNNIQEINLPLKFIPFFCLLSYSSLKVFLSEIIKYDIGKNRFVLNIDKNFDEIIKKYTDYCKYKIHLHHSEHKESIFKDIIFYKNEFHFSCDFPWMIYDNHADEIKTKCFKLKIVFPLITFQLNNFGIKFQKFASKWIIFELIKNNFLYLDRYLLYSLFMNKKLRGMIKSTLNTKASYICNEYNIIEIEPIINDNLYKKNNFEFFTTDVINSKNHYYAFSPYKATITSRYKGKNILNDSMCLQLQKCRLIYNLAKHFGLIGTFTKCIFFNKLNKKYYFSLKFFQNISHDYLIFNEKDDQKSVTNKKYNYTFRNNSIDYKLSIRECLLYEKTIKN